MNVDLGVAAQPTPRSGQMFAGSDLKRKRISIFGHYGAQNLGNECTLRALLDNLQIHAPHADIRCICSYPSDTSARYGISALAISSRSERRRLPHSLLRLMRRIFVGLPSELVHCVRTYRTLRRTEMLVMTGAIFADFGLGPLDLHYEIFKWALLAKLRGCKLVCLSIGVGELSHVLSRWFIKSALSLADYRSYRDQVSKESLSGIGFDASRDLLSPDLAFSLRQPDGIGQKRSNDGPVVIGIGLMGYRGKPRRGEHGEAVYRQYLERMATFVAWLLDRGHTVRLLIGDVVYDRRTPYDLIALLRTSHAQCDTTRLIHEPIRSVEDLLTQLAATDLVVATRFHNVLLALMLGKPALSVSYYHRKNEALMADMGLEEYCQTIDTLDVDRLIEQFTSLQKRIDVIGASLSRKASEYRDALHEQYNAIFAN